MGGRRGGVGRRARNRARRDDTLSGPAPREQTRGVLPSFSGGRLPIVDLEGPELHANAEIDSSGLHAAGRRESRARSASTCVARQADGVARGRTAPRGPIRETAA